MELSLFTKFDWLEIVGVIFGYLSVIYAVQEKNSTWWYGFINTICLFILFYHTNLYADMFLQIYYFLVGIIGVYKWKYILSNKISYLTNKQRLIYSILIVIFSVWIGYMMVNIHSLLPTLFPIPAAYPYLDSIVLVLSVFATVLLTNKKIENWYIWIIVNIICVYLYYSKGIYLLSVQYLVFLIMAIFGYIRWNKKLKKVNG